MAQGRSTKFISVFKCIRTRRLSIKDSLSLWGTGTFGVVFEATFADGKKLTALYWPASAWLTALCWPGKKLTAFYGKKLTALY